MLIDVVAIAFGLERPRQHTTGVRAEESGGRDERGLHALLAQAAAHLGAGRGLDTREIALRARMNEVVVGSETAQLPARHQLAQPVDGERGC